LTLRFMVIVSLSPTAQHRTASNIRGVCDNPDCIARPQDPGCGIPIAGHSQT
jgi:hypothetical protein